jgi:hypothetical protein
MGKSKTTPLSMAESFFGLALGIPEFITKEPIQP